MIRPGEYRLNGAVTTVAHPALQIALHRVMLDKGAEADALHASADDDVPDDALIAHVYVPVIAFPTITQL